MGFKGGNSRAIWASNVDFSPAGTFACMQMSNSKKKKKNGRGVKKLRTLELEALMGIHACICAWEGIVHRQDRIGRI